MSKLTLEFQSAPELRFQLQELIELAGIDAPTPSADSIALFSDAELAAEMDRRIVGAKPIEADTSPPAANEPLAPGAAVKRGRGRPKKDGPAPDPIVPPESMNGVVTVAATPTAPTPPPDKASTSVAPSLPDEDEVMTLISQVYSASNDMMLIRNVLQEVGGKTQLSQIPVALWPTLVERLNGELTRIKESA